METKINELKTEYPLYFSAIFYKKAQFEDDIIKSNDFEVFIDSRVGDISKTVSETEVLKAISKKLFPSLYIQKFVCFGLQDISKQLNPKRCIVLDFMAYTNNILYQISGTCYYHAAVNAVVLNRFFKFKLDSKYADKKDAADAEDTADMDAVRMRDFVHRDVCYTNEKGLAYGGQPIKVLKDVLEKFYGDKFSEKVMCSFVDLDNLDDKPNEVLTVVEDVEVIIDEEMSYIFKDYDYKPRKPVIKVDERIFESNAEIITQGTLGSFHAVAVVKPLDRREWFVVDSNFPFPIPLEYYKIIKNESYYNYKIWTKKVSPGPVASNREPLDPSMYRGGGPLGDVFPSVVAGLVATATAAILQSFS